MIGIDLSDDGIRDIYTRAAERFPSGSTFVELGSLYGASSIYLAQEIKRVEKNIKVYAVDLWEGFIHDTKFEGNFFHLFWQNVIDAGCEKIIIPICLDSSSAAYGFNDKTVDLIYIDANHDYEPCKKDILNWLPKLREEGWIGGHDYHYHVKKIVDELFTTVEQVRDTSWLVKNPTWYRVIL